MSTNSLTSFSMSRRRVLALTSAAAVSVSAFGLPGMAMARQQTGSGSPSTFFAADQVHDMAVTIDQALYDAMIETYQANGDKDWVQASITIDGSTYEQVGLRLKGNSSLSGLAGFGMTEAIAVGGPSLSTASEGEAGATPVAEPVAGVEFRGEATAEEPERLPWLVRLDKYVDGQHHQGVSEFVVRSNHTATSLNEAVALELLTEAGMASQLAAPARFSVNDAAPVLRLVIEHPNDAWMAVHFSAEGLLFKAEAGGDFSYRGDDPADYKDAFDLEAGGTGDDAVDMAPLFAFLAFLNNSDGDTFVAELPNRLAVDQFAIYLAMMDLIDNFDDITGPGNNAYLYVGPDSERFEVVPWDMNLAFGGGGGGAMQFPDGTMPGEGTPMAGADGLQMTPSVEDVEGTPVAGGEGILMMPVGEEGEEGTAAVSMMGMVSNPLLERSRDLTDLTALQESTTTELRATLFEDGVAAAILERWVDVLTTQAADLVDADVVSSEAGAIADFFTR